jgi:broad specificity phosphatase PhoE
MGAHGEIWLFRHGETEWSKEGKHTSRTDLPLTPAGETKALALRPLLPAARFALVLTSPMLRARRTCALLGLGGSCETVDDLREWDYGAYEGRTTAEIQTEAPAWTIWTGAPPGGETVQDVGRRADHVLEKVASAVGAGGNVALFGHGHMLRVLAARWLGLQPQCGSLLALSTGTLSVLGYERDTRVIQRWNQTA